MISASRTHLTHVLRVNLQSEHFSHCLKQFSIENMYIRKIEYIILVSFFSRNLRMSAMHVPSECVHGVWQCVAVCCGVLQCVAVCCSVLQCVAVCCYPDSAR